MADEKKSDGKPEPRIFFRGVLLTPKEAEELRKQSS